VVFEDLECPDCARANPLLNEAVRTYNIPVVVYDFPLPMHKWAQDAAILAKYFGSKSKKLGTEFRNYIYDNQQQITPENLRSTAEKFAAEHGVQLPFAVDPQGKLADAVEQDKLMGRRVGIEHTPTIYVVTNKTSGQPFVEVVDRTQLFNLIDQAKRETASTASSAPARKHPRKAPTS
jgi:protein-disulfide isomerase